MSNFLKKKILETIDLTEEEFEYANSLFKPKKFRKRQFLLNEGDICEYTIFVENGLLRSYTIDDKGAERTLQFAMEGWWAGDLYSFLTGEASAYNIEALENSSLLLINKTSWELLLEEVPAFERFFRIQIQNNLIVTQRRLMVSLTDTAEEKYVKLLNAYPDIVKRVPQHMIASYIGITRETLSRIRKQMVSKS